MYTPLPFAMDAPAPGSYIPYLAHEKTSSKARRPRRRRTFSELQRDIQCPHAECGRVYASKHALNLHLRLKHSANNDTDSVKSEPGTARSTPVDGSRAQIPLAIAPSFSVNSPPPPQSPATPGSVTTMSSTSAESLRDLSEMEELFAIPGTFCDEFEFEDFWQTSHTAAPPLVDTLHWHSLPPARATTPVASGSLSMAAANLYGSNSGRQQYSITMLCNDIHLESLVQEHAAQLC